MAIRTKLVIWHTGVLALVLIAFGVGVYTVLTLSMVRQLEDTLRQAANSALPVFRSTAVRVDKNRVDGPILVPLAELDPFRKSETYVELVTRSGAVFGVSSNLYEESRKDYAPLDVGILEIIRASPDAEQHDAFRTVRRDSAPTTSTDLTPSQDRTPPLYVLTRPVRGEKGDVIGFMQVALSVENIEVAQRILVLALGALGTLGLLISGLLDVLITRRALRPVDRITETALAIYRAENLDQRVPESKTNDEVGRLSAAFNEMLDRLSRLFTAQQRLVADVSHEMRTPLTVIRGNVDLLNTMGCADQASLDALKRESDRMTRMVGDLLLLSQADTGQMSMMLQPVLLSQLVQDVEHSGRVLAGERVHVRASVSHDIVVQADSDRLKQVLLNLLDNALKHTPEGGFVTIEATQVADGMARISVNDTGVGIPEADLPHVFERFYRVEKSRSREHGGSGLGLSIAQKIVQAHRGRIAVSSKLGTGTTFDVFIPVYQRG